MRSIRKWNKQRIYRILSVLPALALWQIAAMAVHKDYLLASPIQVLLRCGALITEPDFFATILFSFLRISAGFALAFMLGIGAAVVAARFEPVHYLLQPFVVTAKTVPVASFIIFLLLILQVNLLTPVLGCLIAFPVLYNNVYQGIRSADGKLVEMANLYHIPFGRRFVFIYMPAVKPFLLSACSTAIGLAWKSGVAAEVIGVVQGSVGRKLYDAKIYLQNADLLAWTVLIIALSLISEKIVVCLLQLLFGRISLKDNSFKLPFWGFRCK